MEMGRRLDRSFAGSPRSLRLGPLGLVVAAVRAVLGFRISYSSSNPREYVALGLVVFGIAIGFIAITWGCYDFIRASGRFGPFK
jgi:hypothetical protein